MSTYGEVEWTPEQWKKAWTVRVGRAYACAGCGTMVMVTKGGVGVLRPVCCGEKMDAVDPGVLEEG